MAGIYIHIPYCRHKCSYCNFFSVVSRKSMDEMIQAICREMKLRLPVISSDSLDKGIVELEITRYPVDTVYLGGGTPSLIDSSQLKQIFDNLHLNYNVSATAEITLEANPDDITTENLIIWKELGINRLSIGIQSFRQEDLNYLNRVHTVETAIDSIQLARKFGFADMTIDLIYGIPTLSNDQWINNLELFAELSIPHLSAYSLTVEPRTPLFKLIDSGKIQPVDEIQSSEQFDILMKFMENHGYLHYEISNFCLPGHYAKHNLSYWKGIDYLGFGPSAHSFNGTSRQWNVSSIHGYLEAIKLDTIPAECEKLTLSNLYNENVMTGLRTMWGCNTIEIKQQFGVEYEHYFQKQATKWLDQSMLNQNGSIYTLTTKGKFLADGIASDLFYI